MGTGRRLVCCHYLVPVRSETIFLDAARCTSIKVTACFASIRCDFEPDSA